MRILHAYCLNYNLGDHALGFGLKHLLRQSLPVESIAEVNLQGQVFDEYFIEIINANYDLLVIGGGGIIHGAHWPQGWFWLIEKMLIRKLRIPFLVFGVGYNYFKNEGGIPPHGKLHLEETAKRARLFAVRNDGSHQRLLDDAGIDAAIVADPGFWVPRAGTWSRPAALPKPYVLLQLANDKLASRLDIVDGYNILVERFRALVNNINVDYQVVLCPHVLNDITLSRDVARGMPNTTIWPFADFAFDNVAGMFGYYQHAAAVLAMRGHGQILGIAFGRPTVSLENHHKHIGLMRDMGLARYNVDINDQHLADTAPMLMREAIADGRLADTRTQQRLDMLWQESVITLQNAAMHGAELPSP